MIYITNLFQVVYITPFRISSKRYSKKFTSLTIPKNLLTKREDRIIQSHSEFVNSEKKGQKRAWPDISRTQDLTQEGKSWVNVYHKAGEKLIRSSTPFHHNHISCPLQLKPLLNIFHGSITKYSWHFFLTLRANFISYLALIRSH